MRYLIVVIFTLLLAAPVWASDESRRDGNTWNELSNTTKNIYIGGFADGYFKFLPCAREDNLSIPPETTINQIVSGVDEFYRDFRNHHVLILDAILIVMMQLSGFPEQAIEKSIKDFRQSTN